MIGKIFSFVFGFIVGTLFGYTLIEKLIKVVLEKIGTGGI